MFREIAGLTRIGPIPIGHLRGRGAKEDYGRSFVPEGPIIIDHPDE